MSGQLPSPTVPTAGTDLTKRDLVVDGVRVSAVIVVMVAHLLLVGVGTDATGALVLSKPLAEQPWFPAAALVGEVMPVFFALGGFAAYTGWHSLRRRGGGYAEFLGGRLRRLARPSLVLFTFFCIALGGALLIGIPATAVDPVAAGAGTPLWFLAAFVLTQWAAPAMIELHQRAPWRALAALAAAAMAVDAVRWTTGIEAVGLLNTAFVWLFAQQLGFFYADGSLLNARKPVLLGFAAVAAALLWGGVSIGVYTGDMLHNQYPPLFALGLLGIVQVCALGLLHRPLTALMRTRIAQAATFAVGSRLMTVYLWHLTCIIAVIGICLEVPGWSPPPGSSAWWATRPLVLVAALALVFAVSLVVVRFERSPATPARGVAETWRLQVATVLVFIPPFLIMSLGLNVVLAFTALTGFALALALIRPHRRAA